MCKLIVLRAKLRKFHDRDIEKALSKHKLEQGEMSDLVRRGFRMALKERGFYTIDDMKIFERSEYLE